MVFYSRGDGKDKTGKLQPGWTGRTRRGNHMQLPDAAGNVRIYKTFVKMEGERSIMQENQNKNRQQDEAARRRKTLIGIIVLLILGFAVNYFFGGDDSNGENGQDNYTAGVVATPGVSGTAAPTQGTDDTSGGESGDDVTGNEEGTDGESGDDVAGNEEGPDGESGEDTTGNNEEPDGKSDGNTAENKEGVGSNTEGNNPDTANGENTPENNPNQADASEIEILYEFRRASYLEQHFEKHGAEFDYATKEEYLAGANRVIQSPDALHKIEAEDGDDIYYLEETNEFVVVSTDGYIRTYFRPSAGIDYYNRQ